MILSNFNQYSKNSFHAGFGMNTCIKQHSRGSTSNRSLAIFEPVHDTNWSLIGLKLSLSFVSWVNVRLDYYWCTSDLQQLEVIMIKMGKLWVVSVNDNSLERTPAGKERHFQTTRDRKEYQFTSRLTLRSTKLFCLPTRTTAHSKFRKNNIIKLQ